MIDRLLRLGEAPALRTELVAALGAGVVTWLEREYALVAARAAAEVPCPEADPSCTPRLSPRRADAHVLLCGRDDDRCSPEVVPAASLVRRKLDVVRLAELVAAAVGASSGLHIAPLGDEALRVGTPAGAAHDMHLVHGTSVSETTVAALAPGPALVLVGERALIRTLRRDAVDARLASSLLALDEDGLRAVRKVVGPRLVERDDPPPVPMRDLDLPRPDVWENLYLSLVDGHTVRIRVGNQHAKRSFSDLGMRNRKTMGPDATWKTLVVLCRGGGDVHWRDVGNTSVVSRMAVSRLRARLRAVFGLEEDPFVRVVGRVKVRFGARGEGR